MQVPAVPTKRTAKIVGVKCPGDVPAGIYSTAEKN